MSADLFVCTGQGLALPEALRLFSPTLPEDGAAALLYTPGQCLFARLTRDGNLADGKGRATLAGVYEARVFHEKAELRWRNDPGKARLHRTAVLATAAFDIALAPMPLERTVLDTHPLTYLLWGEGVGPNHGLGARWGRLAAARIGILDVPVEGIGTLWRVKLHALEYLAEYAHGNVAVAEERLMKLEVERG